ncbi:alpha/beta hydrolase [Catellatospora sp. TT07R-123]|uniref:alpha/beta fold hydrolase n=1 Tax=Catellatospora sp. TT07R-123 TaxID=2733863 RepID=UPI001AFEF955|nr:alpha/beta hydrolase [Catellatospora sp. TT07R-123]GHJ49153.1 alpha/beta hydrolase [Catellatospora sp. TT07R-123]
MTTHEFRTASGVRLRPVIEQPGDLNWLLLPGGPGIGSEILQGLAETVRVPGVTWLVDLPGDGSNTAACGDPFAQWPDVLVEAARALPRPVFVGHSTGGMYLLSIAELEPLLAGIALVSSAPHAGWLTDFVHMAQENPLPAVDAATTAFDADPTDANLGRITVASAPWNFTPDGLAVGTELLARMPYNTAAVNWSAQNFDSTYELRWWPAAMPTLIVSGAQDRIVAQRLWDEPRFQGRHVLHRQIEGAAHFPWIERPDEVRDAFHELAAAVAAG